MDGIRRSDINPNLSISDFSAEETPDQSAVKPDGLSGVADQMESFTAAPDWTSGNQHDPGITSLELQSFLAEPLLFRADEISRRSPELSTAATQIAKPFYNNVMQSMSFNDPSNDDKLLHDELAKVGGTETYAVLGDMNGTDIEALCFLVLMAASKSAQEDLKAIMSQVKQINQTKEGWRETANAMKSDAATEQTPRRFLAAASDALSVYAMNLSDDDDNDPD